jgi:hypothetical protein
MATKAQTNANRTNSKKSTGPKTPEGKAAVSQNAVKHGLFADATVVNGENQADYDLYRDALLDEWRPVGVMESILGERLVSLAWRLRRAERMQNQVIDEMIERLKPTALEIHTRAMLPKIMRQAEEDDVIPEPAMALGRMAQKDWAHNRVLDRMMMYERRIESSMIRTMHQLKKLSIMRRIEREDVEERSARQMSPAANHMASLKKQSQFDPALMDVRAYTRRDYRDKARPDSAQNKAKQSQFHRAAARKGAGKRDESLGVLAR